jgi:hypothetical protein
LVSATLAVVAAGTEELAVEPMNLVAAVAVAAAVVAVVAFAEFAVAKATEATAPWPPM